MKSAIVALAAAGLTSALPPVKQPNTADQGRTLERVETPAAADDPARVLDDFHDAAAKADFDRYFSHWTDQSVFLGTDATERWVGQEFKDFAKPYFDQGKGWTYRPRDRHISPVPGKDLAYFDELLDHDRLGVCRGSGMLERQQGGWKILQYNLSIPIPNDAAARVVALIRDLPPAPRTDGKHKE